MLSAEQLDAFASDLDEVRAEADAAEGPADVAHMRKLVWWSRACSLVGWATAWIAPNPLSTVAISTGNLTRWTIVGHHLCHRAVDGLPGAPAAWHSRRFARGRLGSLQWLDWMPVEAWHEEHDLQHHYRLGEDADPDVAESNLDWLADGSVPRRLRPLVLWILALVWKPTYYAANTINAQHSAAERRRGERTDRLPLLSHEAWLPWYPRGRDLLLRSWLPNVLLRFALPIGAVSVLSTGAALALAVNLVLAELLANLHGFLVVVPNHTGPDLQRFREPAGSRAEFLLRQVLGSTNYRCGGDLNDFLHGWLNYQVEHHLWPDLSPLQLRRVQPRVKEVCERHGVPYIQESVWRRAARMTSVLVGHERAPVMSTRPAELAST